MRRRGRGGLWENFRKRTDPQSKADEAVKIPIEMLVIFKYLSCGSVWMH